MKTVRDNTGHRRREKREGATLVEFAVTLPILITLLFASVEFSRANVIRNSIRNAAYEGARAAMLPGANAASVKRVVRRSLRDASVDRSNIIVTPTEINDNVDEVTVEVKVNVAKTAILLPRFLSKKFIKTECTLSREFVSK